MFFTAVQAHHTIEACRRGLWTWGNIAALRIEATTRENASAYRCPDGFQHSGLLGVAIKA